MSNWRGGVGGVHVQVCESRQVGEGGRQAAPHGEALGVASSAQQSRVLQLRCTPTAAAVVGAEGAGVGSSASSSRSRSSSDVTAAVTDVQQRRWHSRSGASGSSRRWAKSWQGLETPVRHLGHGSHESISVDGDSQLVGPDGWTVHLAQAPARHQTMSGACALRHAQASGRAHRDRAHIWTTLPALLQWMPGGGVMGESRGCPAGAAPRQASKDGACRCMHVRPCVRKVRCKAGVRSAACRRMRVRTAQGTRRSERCWRPRADQTVQSRTKPPVIGGAEQLPPTPTNARHSVSQCGRHALQRDA
jgi:hypothetical protein